MKKFSLKLVLILCAILVFSSMSSFAEDNGNILGTNEILFSQKTHAIDAIDPNTTNNLQGSFYPGLRGANQLIIYTPSFGLRTNTNEFGTEAIVEGNTVSSLSGADSIIPSNGIVISGHEIAKKWINENVIVGSKIYVDSLNKELNVYVTSDSYLYGAREKIKEAQEIISYYRKKLVDYNYEKPCCYIQQAEKYLKKAERYPNDVQKYSALAIEN